MQIDMEIVGGQDYVAAQVRKHLGLLHDLEAADAKTLQRLVFDILPQVRVCWQGISNKYYNREETATLDVNNSNQYCQLLLMLARQASLEGNIGLADKIFGLNKMLNSCDIYHAVALPDCFYIDHSLGIVVGRAQLGENLFLSQNCTIGSNPGQPDYPVLGAHNYLMSNVTLVGNVKTGDRVIFATGSFAKDIEIPSDCLVFGRAPDTVIKPLKPESFQKASPFVL